MRVFLITDDSYDGGSSSPPRMAFLAAPAFDFCAVGSVGVCVDDNDEPPAIVAAGVGTAVGAGTGTGVSCGCRWNKEVTASVMLCVAEV